MKILLLVSLLIFCGVEERGYADSREVQAEQNIDNTTYLVDTFQTSLFLSNASSLFVIVGVHVFKILNISVIDFIPESIIQIISLRAMLLGHNGIFGNLLYNEVLLEYLSDQNVYAPIREEFTDRFLTQDVGMRRLPKLLLHALGFSNFVEFVDHPAVAACRILISSYLFMIQHTQYFHDREQINRVFFAGLAFGVLQEYSGHMFYSTFAHLLHNNMVSLRGRLFGAPFEDDFDSIFEDF
jgi:hypothetical protein